MKAPQPRASLSSQATFRQAIPRRRLAGSALFLRGVVLGIVLVPLVGAFSYAYVWPQSQGDCSFQNTYGIFGPACGFTRSFVAIAKGNWLKAIQFHLFGPVLFGLCSVVSLQAALELCQRRPLPERWNLSTYLGRSPWPLAVLTLGLMLYYAVRLLCRYGTDVPPALVQQTQLWQFITTGAAML